MRLAAVNRYPGWLQLSEYGQDFSLHRAAAVPGAFFTSQILAHGYQLNVFH